MKLSYKKSKIEIPVKKVSFFGKLSGLMFRTKDTDNLLFENSRGLSLHSCFVFFDFLVLWTDKKNNIMDFEIVRPFRFYIRSRKSFEKIVEIPLNRKNSKIVDFFVGKRKV